MFMSTLDGGIEVASGKKMNFHLLLSEVIAGFYKLKYVPCTVPVAISRPFPRVEKVVKIQPKNSCAGKSVSERIGRANTLQSKDQTKLRLELL